MKKQDHFLAVEKLLNEKIMLKEKLIKENKLIENLLTGKNFIRKNIKITKTHNKFTRFQKTTRDGSLYERPKNQTIIDEWEFENKNYTELEELNAAIRIRVHQIKEQKKENEQKITQLDSDISDLRRRLSEINNSTILKIAPNNDKSKSHTDYKSVDYRIHDIIKIVSAWKNIEGNYTQNQLADKLNINKGTLTRFFKKEVNKNGIKKNAKGLLINKVSEAITMAEEKESYEIKARLNEFYKCLVNEAPTKDRGRGKQNKPYYNPHEKD